MNKRPNRRSSKLSGHGFDYGIGITAAAVGSLEFNKNLMAADIIAVAYGFDYSTILDVQVPAITLLGRNEKPLRKAFEEFTDWASWSDADAIELVIVFLKSGGYRLCIRPEVSALYRRVLQYDTVVNPMAFQLTWIKAIATTSQSLNDIRRMLSTGIIRPFILRAARYSGISLTTKSFDPGLIEQISLGPELLKFEIGFLDEGSEEDSHWPRIALGDRDSNPLSRPNDSHIQQTLVWTRRKEALKRLFPVTLWRSNSNEWCSKLRSEATSLGIFEWQVNQAICNLVLSQEIADGKLHFRGIAKQDFQDRIWNALCGRFEVADGNRLSFQQLTLENIVHQVILDARVMLKHYGVKRMPTTLDRVLVCLKRKSLHCEPEE